MCAFQDKISQANPDGMMVCFLSNHDMDRSAGYLMLANHFPQMAANLYLLCSGSPFLYYGEEIGMKGVRGSANTDANRRLPCSGETTAVPGIRRAAPIPLPSRPTEP